MSPHETLTIGLLPDKRLDWRKFVLGYGVLLFLLLCLLVARLIWPDRLGILANYTVTEVIARPDLVPEKYRARVKPKPMPRPKVQTPKLMVFKEMPRPRVHEAKIEAPRIQASGFEAPKLPPVSAAMPAKLVHTGSFASSAVATVNAPVQKVQTGGFGDPNGLPGQGKQGAKLVAAKLGSFDLPQGPGTGNGTGGAKGTRGTIASAGFGNGIAGPGQLDGRRNGQGPIREAGFAAEQVATNSGRRSLESAGAATQPVEILAKPKPVYTEEARRLNLEGEVLLEVKFGADGELRVNRVVRGLGHGLDEAAVSAANHIKFKPAQRNGTAVDSTAIVHVVFQLAS
jgi:TonB family protein